MSEQFTQPPPAPLSPAEEKQWAMFAHLSVWINMFTGFLGIAAAFLIYLIYKDRSRFVAFHAMQATLMQAGFWLGGSMIAALSSAGMSFIPFVGLICIPFACVFALLPLAALGYGTYGGLQVNNGQDFKYWLFGDWAQNMVK